MASGLGSGSGSGSGLGLGLGLGQARVRVKWVPLAERRAEQAEQHLHMVTAFIAHGYGPGTWNGTMSRAVETKGQ